MTQKKVKINNWLILSNLDKFIKTNESDLVLRLFVKSKKKDDLDLSEDASWHMKSIKLITAIVKTLVNLRKCHQKGFEDLSAEKIEACTDILKIYNILEDDKIQKKEKELLYEYFYSLPLDESFLKKLENGVIDKNSPAYQNHFFVANWINPAIKKVRIAELSKYIKKEDLKYCNDFIDIDKYCESQKNNGKQECDIILDLLENKDRLLLKENIKPFSGKDSTKTPQMKL